MIIEDYYREVLLVQARMYQKFADEIGETTDPEQAVRRDVYLEAAENARFAVEDNESSTP